MPKKLEDQMPLITGVLSPVEITSLLGSIFKEDGFGVPDSFPKEKVKILETWYNQFIEWKKICREKT